MNGSPKQPDRGPPPDYRMRDLEALDAEVERHKELVAQRAAARAAEKQRKKTAVKPKPETEQERKETFERNLHVPRAAPRSRKILRAEP